MIYSSIRSVEYFLKEIFWIFFRTLISLLFPPRVSFCIPRFSRRNDSMELEVEEGGGNKECWQLGIPPETVFKEWRRRGRGGLGTDFHFPR